jgi:TrmH family RNA methyltransferase
MRYWRDNIRIVLVEPRESGIIGACARAMKNMGFRNLCLVNPAASLNADAKWFACHAGDVLEKALVCQTLAEAVGDVSLVVGTSRRKGRRRGVFMEAGEGCRRVLSVAGDNRVAILFGREDRGLFNQEVEQCGLLLTIPASKEQPSLNLSHAVMIIAYELRRVGGGGSVPERETVTSCREPETIPGGGQALVTHAEISALYARMAGALELLGYFPRGDRDLEKKMMANLRHFIGRAGLTDWELKMLHGICSRIEKKCSGGT